MLNSCGVSDHGNSKRTKEQNTGKRLTYLTGIRQGTDATAQWKGAIMHSYIIR